MPEDPDPPVEPAERGDASASGSGSVDVKVAESGSIVRSSRLAEGAAEDASIERATESGSIDVQTAESGSIDVQVSGPVPVVDPRPSTAIEPDAAIPVEGSKPIPQTGRRQRLTEGVKDAVGGGMTRLGTGIEHLGEGVSKLGEKSRKVPVVGAGVSMIGESLTSVGESLTELPRVAKTRRGRLLVRSMFVAFVLVFAWISVIVALQVRGTNIPDFRPDAHRFLSELSKGSAEIEAIYEEASPRFQEMVRKERFVEDMIDLNTTIGKYLEIAAVNESIVTTGPTGRVGRVSLTVAYEKGKSKASVSLHFHEGEWKLLGIGVELPPEVQISQAQREERVQACKDPMDPKKCDVFVAANTILEQLRDGQAAQVWDAATSVFQKQEEKSRFVALQDYNQRVLGEYKRIILVTEAKVIGGTHATFDVVTEYAKSNGVRAIFGFYRRVKGEPWKLRSLKIVLPMPRADEGSGSATPSELGGSGASAPSLPPPPAGSATPATPKSGSG